MVLSILCKHSNQQPVPWETFFSLPQLEKEGVGPISRLPVSIRVVLESVLRNCDSRKITEADVRALANWRPNADRTEEIPFIVARVLLQDFTGGAAACRSGRDALVGGASGKE